MPTRHKSVALLAAIVMVVPGLEFLGAGEAAANPRDGVSPAAKTDAPAERPDSVSAMATARATGEHVEDASQRTESVQVFALPSGAWTTESSLGPERVHNSDGSWSDIDTTLVPVDGGFAPKHADTGLVVSDGGDEPPWIRRRVVV